MKTISKLGYTLAKGADVNAKDKEGKSPLHYAERKAVAELLLAKGADVNAKDNEGKTPLHCATRKDTVELLLATGADVNAKDNGGETPLHCAERRVAKDNLNLNEMIEVLRQHGGKE